MLLWVLLVLTLLGWGGGFFVAGAGSLIHLLLIVALIVLIFQLFNRGSGGWRSGP